MMGASISWPLRLRDYKSIDEGSATATPVPDEFIELEFCKESCSLEKIMIKNWELKRAEETLVVDNFPSNGPISYGARSREKSQTSDKGAELHETSRW